MRILIVVGLVAGILVSPATQAATVPGIAPDLVIEAGDVVVWDELYGSVEAYDGSWQSPFFSATNIGRFEKSFTVEGEHPLSFRRLSQPPFPPDYSGNILVLPADTNVIVRLNSPRGGFHSSGSFWYQATVRLPTQSVHRVEFLQGDEIRGVATNYPYAVLGWASGEFGQTSKIVAKAYDRAGNVHTSPPIEIRATYWYDVVSLPQMLPDGAFMFRYSLFTSLRHCVIFTEDFFGESSEGMRYSGQSDSGVIIDTGARGRPYRFYRGFFCP